MIVLFLLSAPPSRPQEQQPLTKPLQYEVSVILKLIHIYVTDSKGKPVEDLTKDDFVVTDDGRPVTVTAFEKHLLAAAPPKAKPAEQFPESPPPAPSLPPLSGEMNRKFFLYFDFAFTDARGIMMAKKAALHFLNNQVAPEDGVSVISYSTLKGLTFHEFMTKERPKVRELIEKIGRGEFAGRAFDFEDRYWRLVQEPLPARWKALLLSEARGEREDAKRIAQTFILNMTALAKALRYVPGQKHFILFSSGVPSSLIYGNQAGNPAGLGGNAQFDPGDPTLRTQNEDMSKEFAASGCTFYAFDTRESSKVPNLFAYDEMTFAIGSRGLTEDQDVFSENKDVFRDERTTGSGSLKRLTEVTGGKYYSNISQYEKNLDQVQNLTGAYYVLGYSISQQRDGRFHEVKVGVKRKGCTVGAQTGYFNPKPFSEFSKLEKELQLFDLALNARSEVDLPKAVPMAALFYDAGEGTRLRTVSRISKDVLAGFGGKNAEFVALIFDDHDNLVSLQRTATDISRGGEQGIVFTSGHAAKPGTYKCRLVVRDLDTGRSAVGSMTVHVPALPRQDFVIFSPLLLTAGEPSANLDGAEKGTLDVSSWRDIYPYDTATHTPILGEQPVSPGKVVGIVPYRVQEAGQAKVGFSTHLINLATGQNLPLAFRPLDRLVHGNIEILFLEFTLDDVPAGSYALFINGADKTSGHLTSAHVPLTVSR
jgi:VWFA-related protein